MAYANLPPNLQAMFQDLTDRLNKLENAQRFTMPNTPPVVTQPTITGLQTDDPTLPRTGDQWLNSTANALRYVDALGVAQQIVPISGVDASTNIVINGAMDFSQRGSFFSVTSGAYTLDRWWVTSSESTGVTVSQDSGTPFSWPSPYTGLFNNGLGISTNNATLPANTAWVQVVQPIETLNVYLLRGRKVTLSSYVTPNPSQGGNVVTMSLYSTATTNASPSAYSSATLLASTTVSGANGANFVFRPSVTVTVPSSAGTLFVVFSVTNTTAGSLRDPSNIGVFVSGVQLTATPAPVNFVRSGVTIGGEFLLCQRYYQRLNFGNGTTSYVTTTQATGATSAIGALPLPVIMRAAPTASVSAVTDFGLFSATGTANTLNGFTVGSTPQSIKLAPTVASGLVAGNASVLYTTAASGSGWIDASAEL